MMLRENPNLFAAGIPMSGEDDPTMAAKIAKIPIWAFHGAMDTAINVKGSRDMIAAIQAAGGHPRYTEYPNGQHDIWFQAYNTPELQTQCHVHVHLGKWISAVENAQFITVQRADDRPSAPRRRGPERPCTRASARGRRTERA